jgi:hypothetical protein
MTICSITERARCDLDERIVFSYLRHGRFLSMNLAEVIYNTSKHKL